MNVVFVLCVDLSQPGTVIEETMEWLKIIRAEGERFVQEKMLIKQDVNAFLNHIEIP